MTCAFRMKKEFAKILPSAIHIDNTARPQLVEKNDNENYYKNSKRNKEALVMEWLLIPHLINMVEQWS